LNICRYAGVFIFVCNCIIGPRHNPESFEQPGQTGIESTGRRVIICSMSSIDNFLKEFPPGAFKKIKQLWEVLPASMQQELEMLIKAIPSKTALVRRLTELAVRNFKIVSGQKKRVAIVGPTNVGKSTLYNQFTRASSDRAEVGPAPGTTRESQTADAGLFDVVDTPGADAVGEVGQAEKLQAFETAQKADFLIIMFDAIQGVKKTEQELFAELTALDKPFLVVLNKIDLVKRATRKVIETAAASLNLSLDQIVATNAKDGKNVAQVLLAVAKSDPEIVAAMARALPDFRRQLAWTTVSGAAVTAGFIGVVPLPIIDFAPLIVVQSSMVLSIARIYDYKITLVRAKEIVATFGLGLLGRSLFQQLSKLGGLPGDILAGAVAASTTAVMGIAAIRWFEKGDRLSSDALKKLTREFTENLLRAVPRPGKKRAGKADFKKALQSALEYGSLPQDATASVSSVPEPPSLATIDPVTFPNPEQKSVSNENDEAMQPEPDSFIVDWQI
jgi:GTPase